MMDLLAVDLQLAAFAILAVKQALVAESGEIRIKPDLGAKLLFF